MDMPRNEFKRAIAAGRQQIGLWCTLTGASTIEALSTCGYDWLLLDTEHSPGDPLTILPMLQAMAPYPVAPIVRPASSDPVLIKRLLDFGVQTLLVPYVQTAEEARAAVAAVRYPPAGIRGVAGLTRATRYGRIPNYTATADPEICLLVQVETQASLSEIEAIAAIDGVDGVFIGPADLSASMGYPGQLAHGDVVAAIEDAIGRIRKAGKAAGILTVNPDFARRCIELGTTFTAVEVDANILLRGADRVVSDFKSA